MLFPLLVQAKPHAGLHSAWHMMSGMLSPFVFVYVIAGGLKLRFSGPSWKRRNIRAREHVMLKYFAQCIYMYVFWHNQNKPNIFKIIAVCNRVWDSQNNFAIVLKDFEFECNEQAPTVYCQIVTDFLLTLFLHYRARGIVLQVCPKDFNANEYTTKGTT